MLEKKKANFGTAPVFFTAISTILGAIMFLRFGYAVGSVGFLGTIGIILFANLVTIPTAWAISEIATNQKVEGGGEYYIISRSFGINVGAAIGIALYLSQAISVAFYVIAFAEAFGPVYDYVNTTFDLTITNKRLISLPAVILLSWAMLRKGADLGTRTLYVVVTILFLSLLLFFMGHTEYAQSQVELDWLAAVENPDSFFVVFAIVFPAFTGMTAGVGLSGDLKNPKRSIPLGTMMATLMGTVIYVFIAYKLAQSASPEALVEDQLIMSQIALWPPIIPIGLAAATISSALGSIMVAPRTLQALASDKVLLIPGLNRWLAKGSLKNHEPVNATVITSIIAIFFVAVGDVNAVAEVISMFFMITYGSICLISFLQHFAADPSYRPSFRSRWYISATGAIMCVYLMFSMNGRYAFIAVVSMTVMYIIIDYSKKDNEGLVRIFQGVIFQFSRQLQVFLQNADRREENWRPSVICISTDFFHRPAAFQLMRWVSQRYGFGTYIHFIKGYFSRDLYYRTKEELNRLIKVAGSSRSNVYIDTMVSPSYTSAIAQAIQLPSVSGKDLNMILFEYDKEHNAALQDIVDNFSLVRSADLDICVLAASEKEFGFMKSIHIWLKPSDIENGSLMIMMGYVLLGHKDWKKAKIKIFAIFPEEQMAEEEAKLIALIKEGRLPISAKNVESIPQKEDVAVKQIIAAKSKDADLTLVGFRMEMVKQNGLSVFEGYEEIGNVLFVNTAKGKEIE